MNSTRSESRFPIRTLTLAAILALAGSTATTTLADDKPADKSQSNDDALKGPEVKDRNVPGGRSSFGGGQGERRRDGAGGPGPMVMMRVLRTLGSDEAPEEVRASPDQADEIREIIEEFREEQRAFRDEHQEEIKSLREKAGLPAGEARRGPGPGGPDGVGPGGPGGPPPEGEDGAPKGKGKQARKQQRAEATPEQQEARQQLKALMDQGPKFETYQARIWEVLSAEQQTYVKAKVEEFKANPQAMGPGGRGPGPDSEEGRPARGKGAKKGPRNAPPPADDDMMAPTPPPSEEE